MFKQIFLIAMALLLSMIIPSCQKDVDQKPSPAPVEDTAAFLQVRATGLNLPGQSHYAIISIVNSAGQVVLQNKKISIDEVQGRYLTDKISLVSDRYRITKFIITNAKDTAVYASPLLNSEKAALVSKPLAVDLSISRRGVTVTDVEVVPVSLQDEPASFGYTHADFGFMAYLNLKAKLKILLGDVLYDSLPGRLSIDATDAQNNHWVRTIDLGKGVTTLRVPAQYVQYTFRSSKWNVPIERSFSRAALSEHFLVNLEGFKAPKQLVREVSFLELASGLREESRTEYSYGGNNKLSGIRYFQRLPQYANLQLQHVYAFRYSGGQLDTISRYAPDNTRNGFTAFSYTGAKITGMHNKSFDQQTYAAVEYTGTALNPRITIDYLFSNGNSMLYRMDYSSGNKVSERTQSSTGAAQTAVFGYDDNINPYHQLGYPDLFFTNSSINNRVLEQANYGGSFPSVIPYKFEYSYDADGYPAFLYVSYKGFTSGQHLYRIKNVFSYR